MPASRCSALPASARRLLSALSLVALGMVALPADAVAQNGTVSGAVTNAAGGAPLTGGTVRFCTAASVCTSIAVDGSGQYSISLAAGTYFASTLNFNTQGFVNEIFDNVPCAGPCQVSTSIANGTPIVVPAGGTVTGRNFGLATGGVITGVVTDAASGAPLANVSVNIRTRVGTLNVSVGTTATNASGVYTFGALATATYTASTSNSLGYVNEIYDDVLCLGGCNTTTVLNSGSPIPVTIGATTSGRNFALTLGGQITGNVTNSLTGLPIASATVNVVMKQGTTLVSLGGAATNASGDYTIRGLPTGTYYLFTSVSNVINEFYDNQQCPGVCNSNLAAATTPVAVVAGGTVASRNFALDPGGAISGTVTAAGTGLPVNNVAIGVYRQSAPSTATLVQFSNTDATGAYTVAGLPTGTYFAVAFPPSPFATETFGGTFCFCSSSEILASTPISVTSGATTSGRNFALDLGVSVSGTVTEDGSGVPVANAFVGFYTDTPVPRFLGFTTTNAVGLYNLTGLPPGTYFITVETPGYRAEAFNNVTCPSTSFCTAAFVIANGTPITLAAGGAAANINVGLAAAPTVPTPNGPTITSVTVAAGVLSIAWTPASFGPPATSFRLEAGLTSGSTAVTFPTAATSLTLPGVPPGTFFIRVRAINASGLGGTSQEVTLNVDAAGNMRPTTPVSLVAWTTGSKLSVTWANGSLGPNPTSYVLEVLAASGGAPIVTLPVTNRHFLFNGVPPGFYFLRVRSRAATQVSLPTTEVMINVGNVPAPPGPPQNFSVSISGSTVTFTWTAPVVGVPTTYVLEAGTATGLSNIAVFNTGSAATQLVIPGVPPGTFFVRLRARNAQGNSPPSTERSFTIN
jgi:5-hydroxyisourate hydrolase-like protein (transthyretin family)